MSAVTDVSTGIAAQPVSAAIRHECARLLAGASLEMHVKEAPRLAALRGWLAPGTRIYLPALASQPVDAVLAAARAIHAAGFEPVPHVAARRVAGRGELQTFLSAAHAESGVREVMLIAGDAAAPAGPYRDSIDVLRDGALVPAGIQRIGIAAYPEGHPDIAAPHLEAALEEKLQLAHGQGLAVTIVTQFSFAPQRIVEICAQLGHRHPELPVRVGIAGPADPVTLLKYAQRCGVSASRRAMRHLGRGMARLMLNTDPSDQVLTVARYCEGKNACNVAGLHLFSFGGVLRTARWLRETAA